MIIIIKINIYVTQNPCECDRMCFTSKYETVKHNMIKIPTGKRQTSWLHTKRDGVELGTAENKCSQWQVGGLNPGPPDYDSSD